MIGYWDPSCPVKPSHREVLATAYVAKGKTLVEDSPVQATSSSSGIERFLYLLRAMNTFVKAFDQEPSTLGRLALSASTKLVFRVSGLALHLVVPGRQLAEIHIDEAVVDGQVDGSFGRALLGHDDAADRPSRRASRRGVGPVPITIGCRAATSVPATAP